MSTSTHHTRRVLAVLVTVIVTGAARSVVVKLFFQVGFEKPIFVTLLCLLGQAFSLAIYHILKRYQTTQCLSVSTKALRAWQPGLTWKMSQVQMPSDSSQSGNQDASGNGVHLVTDLRESTFSNRALFAPEFSSTGKDSLHVHPDLEGVLETKGRVVAIGDYADHFMLNRGVEDLALGPCDSGIVESEHSNASLMEVLSQHRRESDLFDMLNPSESSTNNDTYRKSPKPQIEHTSDPGCRDPSHGSGHWLTAESPQVAWVRDVPFWQKLLIPSFFNLANSVMRWTSLLFVEASVYEILINGVDLIISVLAARFMRKRLVSIKCRVAVIVIAAGVILVGFGGALNAQENDDNDVGCLNDECSRGKRRSVIGYLLIVGKASMSVFQDMSEELFMQEADIPVLKLLGYEGVVGAIVLSLIYFPLAANSVIPNESLSDLGGDDGWVIILFAVALTLLFTLAGISSILATAEISAVTRNGWKNLRTTLVWTLGLILFYSNDQIGEGWVNPGSFLALLGFVIMMAGAHAYYKHQANNNIPRSSGNSESDDSVVTKSKAKEDDSITTEATLPVSLLDSEASVAETFRGDKDDWAQDIFASEQFENSDGEFHQQRIESSASSTTGSTGRLRKHVRFSSKVAAFPKDDSAKNTLVIVAIAEKKPPLSNPAVTRVDHQAVKDTSNSKDNDTEGRPQHDASKDALPQSTARDPQAERGAPLSKNLGVGEEERKEKEASDEVSQREKKSVVQATTDVVAQPTTSVGKNLPEPEIVEAKRALLRAKTRVETSDQASLQPADAVNERDKEPLILLAGTSVSTEASISTNTTTTTTTTSYLMELVGSGKSLFGSTLLGRSASGPSASELLHVHEQSLAATVQVDEDDYTTTASVRGGGDSRPDIEVCFLEEDHHENSSDSLDDLSDLTASSSQRKARRRQAETVPDKDSDLFADRFLASKSGKFYLQFI